MGTLEDYGSGRILKSIGKALHVIGAKSLADDPAASHIAQKICEFEPVVVSITEAIAAIDGARTLAVGERVCRPLHPGSVFTGSVFLDELAETMIGTGHARRASKDEACRALDAGKGHPLVMSKVSGRYLEICASVREGCDFWQAERQGIRCIQRKQQ